MGEITLGGKRIKPAGALVISRDGSCYESAQRPASARGLRAASNIDSVNTFFKFS